MKKSYIIFSLGTVVVCILIIIVLATESWKNFLMPKTEEPVMTRVITPNENGVNTGMDSAEQIIWEENLSTYIRMEDNETVINVLTVESELGITEEQFVAWHSDTGGPVYITWISFDEETRRYTRMWDAQTAATRSDTISISIQDLIGDRGRCIIITGMNQNNEHTMTVFRQTAYTVNFPERHIDEPFIKIAELQIDGSIIIQESNRPLAYQQGIAAGQSFNIAAYGHDPSSNNILDQLETIYSYNALTEQYERVTITRIPGSQIEQRRLREILSGTPGVFENFINDLWYYVSPQGTIDTKQYIYFDPSGREIIFFGDETQQVFTWQSSTPTRYGIYIRSQNISISTLRRFVDIELESLDSIKLRVTEDVRLKITVTATWDGTYRRAGNVNISTAEKRSGSFTVDTAYDSSWGRIQFFNSGEYTINTGITTREGRYIFFKVDGEELLELRQIQIGENPDNAETPAERMIYKVEPTENSNLILSRVNLTASGIRPMMEIPVTLTLVTND